MLQIRKSQERGAADHGWLKSHHSFSFADYYDPNMMGFRDLRVINEDEIAPGAGFPMHGHRDMEIITYVVRGKLEHKDSMGNTAQVLPGEVQHMSAGTGVMHSEYNPQMDHDLKLFQIWIQPDRRGLKPGYGQKSFASELASGQLVLTASQSGRDGSLKINQDADLWIARAKAGSENNFVLREGRYLWLQLLSGKIELKGKVLSAGDALAATAETQFSIKTLENSEFLIFDLV